MSAEETTTVRRALQALLDEHGLLTPELIVDVARAPDHPLHAHFEWDDSVAAERWRLNQAGKLLRVTYKPDPERPTELRAFMPIRGKDTPRSDYRPTEEVLADPFTRELVLRQMDREWRSFKRRYEHMAEFADLIRGEAQGLAS